MSCYSLDSLDACTLPPFLPAQFLWSTAALRARLGFMPVIPNVAAAAFTNQSDRNSSPAKFSPPTNEQCLENLFWISLELYVGNPYEICCSCKNVPKYGNKNPNHPLSVSLFSPPLGTRNCSLNEEIKASVSPHISICKTPNVWGSWWNYTSIESAGHVAICTWLHVLVFQKLNRDLNAHAYRLPPTQMINLCDHLKIYREQF